MNTPAQPPLGDWQTFLMIAALSAGILLTRFAPFVLFARRRTLPRVVRYLGGALPHAAMALLLVYCLKDVSPIEPPHGLPELAALAVTAGLHLWRKNVLLSIAAGTLLYMYLVQR